MATVVPASCLKGAPPPVEGLAPLVQRHVMLPQPVVRKEQVRPGRMVVAR